MFKSLVLRGALQRVKDAYVWELGTQSVGGGTSLVVK